MIPPFACVHTTAVIIFWMLSFVLNQNVLDRPTDVFPYLIFLVPPIAYFRGIHLLVLRRIDLSLISGEMSAILMFLIMDVFIYGLLGAYLDLTWPRPFGVVKHPLFFLGPLLNIFSRKDKRPVTVPSRMDEDSDVAAARKEADLKVTAPRSSTRSGDVAISTSDEPQIQLFSLRKVYKNGKVAVENLSCLIQHGECFGLLGPNGAGKTTTISMLTGLYSPTSGSARVCGFDLKSQIDAIYKVMGVCPQFDILWPLLTVTETLAFYCRMKDIPQSAVNAVANEGAFAVDLGHARDRLVGRLSGGMKRRVSLAISLIGNPWVIYLDEPTTGLDPQTKRAMWSLVDMAKAGRSIILTTHAMEEADALCGRIGIMAYGRLRCIGTSLHLKHKFGEGYKLEVDVKDGGVQAAQQWIQQTVPSATKLGLDYNTLSFQIPFSLVKLSEFFGVMEQRPESACINAWALRQTSMEEVFLKITMEAEKEFHTALPKVTSSTGWPPTKVSPKPNVQSDSSA